MGLSIAPMIAPPRQQSAPSFFGGDTGISYEELQARKKIARELMGENARIRNVGEGINSAAGSIAGALMGRKVRKEEEKQRGAFNDEFNAVVPGLFGGGYNSTVSTSNAPSAPISNGYQSSGDDWTRGKADGVDPRVIEVLSAVREETGIPFVVTEGLRDQARQAEMVRQGKSQTMNSKHRHGGAVDIGIQNPDGSINWDFEAYRPLGESFKRNAAALGYDDAVWGGDWETLKDGVHFQIGGGVSPRMSTQGVQTAQNGPIDPNVIMQLSRLASNPYASPGQQAIVQALLGQQISRMGPPKQKDPTALMQNYEYALSLGMTPDEARAWVKGGVNVNVGDGPKIGTIPQGYELVQDPETGAYSMRPIKGGPEDTTANDEAKAASAGTSAQLVKDEIGIAKELIQGQEWNSPATGIGGKILSGIDSTRAGKLKNRLETIKANIGFDKLQAMREASKTGGALGQVSEFENRLLQAVFGSLEQAQSGDDLLYNLGRLETIYDAIINGIPDGAGRFRAMTEDEATELYKGVVMNRAPDVPDDDAEFLKSLGLE